MNWFNGLRACAGLNLKFTALNWALVVDLDDRVDEILSGFRGRW